MRNILVFIFMISSFSAFSQTYQIEGKFKTDSIYQLTIKRAKISSKQAFSKDLAQLTQIKANFTFISKEKVKCVWKYGETKPTGPEKMISQIGKEYIELLNLYKDFEIELSLDSQTGEIKLLNYEQMKKNIVDSFIKLYANKATAKIDSLQMEQINNQLKTTYSTPELLLSTYFPEIDLYFGLYSKSFEQEAIYEYDTYYPNPFGGEEFPVAGKVRIDSKEKNVLIIKNTSEIDEQNTNRILRETLKRLSEQGKQPINESEIPSFTFNSSSKFYYELNQKIIFKVISEKTNQASGVTQTQILEINLLTE